MPARHPINFTKDKIDALPAAPTGRRMYYADTKIRGLQVMVTDRGSKSFYFYKRNRGKPYRDLLGTYPHLTPENARKKAQSAAGRAAMGEDLRAARHADKRHKATLPDAFTAFKAARVNLKASTLYSYGRFMETAFGDWETTPLVDLSKDRIAHKHRRLGAEHGHAYADGAMRFLRALINFAQYHYEAPDGTALLPDNPVRRLSQTRSWYRVKRRTTYITPEQLKPWFNAVLNLKADPDKHEAVTVADWLLLMILTGLRRGEAQRLAWADVNLHHKTLTVRDTKNHDDHTLPLSDYLHALLESRHEAAKTADADALYVFPSYGKTGYMVDPRDLLKKVTAVVPFTPHDLRRTFATVADSLDISAYALKRLVNHKMRQDVTAGYIITDVERLRKPMQQITDYLLKHAGLKPSADILDFNKERTQ